MNTGNRPAVDLKGERIWRADGKEGKVRSAIEPAHRVCILVLGTHRSGTSALTRVVNLLGCDLPKTLIPANKTNKAGYWESTAICRLNDRILESAGTYWDDWLEFNPGWIQSPKAKEFQQEALAVLQEEFGSSRLFVLKDPRICRIAPFWINILKQVGVQPLIFSPVRNPLEVAASLKDRNGFELSFGHLMWLRHVLDSEFASRGMPRYFTSYDDLMGGWSRVIAEAQSTLGIAWPRFSNQAVVEIDAFLLDEYRHHRESPENVIENPTLSQWLRETFRIFNNWAIAGEKPEDFAALDQVKAEINTAAPAFATFIASGQKAFKKSRALERELADTKAKLSETDAAVVEHRLNVQFLESEIARLNRFAAEQERKADTASTENEEMVKRISELNRAIEAASTDHQAKVKRIAQLKKMIEKKTVDFEKAISEQQVELRKLKAMVHQADIEKRQFDARLAARFKEIAALTRMLEQYRNQAEEIKKITTKQLVSAFKMLLDQINSPFGRQAKIKKCNAILRRAELFDGEWYLQKYKDVAKAGMDPLEHYVLYGEEEGRAPNAAFDHALAETSGES